MLSILGLENMELDFLDFVEQREVLGGTPGVDRKLQVAFCFNAHAAAELQIDDFERIADKSRAVGLSL